MSEGMSDCKRSVTYHFTETLVGDGTSVITFKLDPIALNRFLGAPVLGRGIEMGTGVNMITLAQDLTAQMGKDLGEEWPKQQPTLLDVICELCGVQCVRL